MIRTALPALFRLLRLNRLLSQPLVEDLFLRAFFAYKRLAEDSLARLLARHPELVGDGDVLDIGANVGYTAVVLARHLAPGHGVWAFEPEPVNIRRLSRVLRRHALTEVVTIVGVAVGEREGTVELWRNEQHPGDHRVVTDVFRPKEATLNVPVVSIDAFTEERRIGDVGFIKIDVQGYELMVARGMSRLLERSPSISVLFEYDPLLLSALGTAPRELLDFWRDRGFEIGLIMRGGDVVAADDGAIAAAVEKSGYVDLLCRRPMTLS